MIRSDLAPDRRHASAPISDYRVLGRLGISTSGQVDLAQGPGGQRVAVRPLPGPDRADPIGPGTEFSDEAALQWVTHFCNLELLWTGGGAGSWFGVTPLEGYRFLAQQVAAGPLAGTDLNKVALVSATGLAALHQTHLVHGSFGPANVMIGADGPVVLDFAFDPDPTVTKLIGPTGPPAVGFTAPEQVLNGRVGPATDVFAWASTVFYAATGQLPFPASSAAAQKNRIAYGQPDLIAVPLPLANILGACLSKEPERRPTAEQTLLWLVDNLEPAQDETNRGLVAVREMATLVGAGQGWDRTRRWENDQPATVAIRPRRGEKADDESSEDADETGPTAGRAASGVLRGPSRSGPGPAGSSRGRRGFRLAALAILLTAAVTAAVAVKARWPIDLLGTSGSPRATQSTPLATAGPAAPSGNPARSGLNSSSGVPTAAPTKSPASRAAGPTASPSRKPTASTSARPRSPGPSPSAPTVPARFAGTWTGTLFQPAAPAQGYSVVITMASGARTGSYSLPTAGCRAVLTVTAASQTGTQLNLLEQVTSDPGQQCAPNARITLTINLRGQRQASIRWQDAANPMNTATGTLTKQ